MHRYAILRIKKFQSVCDLVKAVRHNERSFPPMNAEKERAHLNIQLIGDPKKPIQERWKERLLQAGLDPTRLRKNAVTACELLCGFSPEMRPHIDPREFARLAVEWASRLFGAENILSAVHHADERTPHVQILFTPIVLKPIRGNIVHRLAATDLLGSPDKLEKLQDSYAEQMRVLGLERGRPGSMRKHVPLKDWYGDTNKMAKNVESISAAIARMAESFVQSPRRGLLAPKKSLEESVKDSLSPLAELAMKGVAVENLEIAQAEAERKLREEREGRKKAEEELRRQRQTDLRQIEITRVFEVLLRIAGRPEGGSIVFETDAHKFVCTDQKFKDFKSDPRGGGGAIDAAMQGLGCDFEKAVAWLETEFPGHAFPVAKAHVESILKAPLSPPTLAEKMERFAARDDTRWSSVESYLTDVRGLPKSIIHDLFSQQEIYANAHGSAVFVHRDESREISGATIRGVSSDFKQAIGVKDVGQFAIGPALPIADSLLVTESPIDALSLASLHVTRGRIISSGGATNLYHIAEQAVEAGKPVVAAFDADAPGEAMSQSLEETVHRMGGVFRRLKPTWGKDWNDQFLFLKTQFTSVVHRAEDTYRILQAAWARNLYQQPQHQTSDRERHQHRL